MAPEISKEHAIETYKSMIQISVEAIKLLALFNGGAAVALLPYLVSVAGKGATARGLGVAMLCYLVGLVLCGATFLASYLTQLGLYNESMRWLPLNTHRRSLRVALIVGCLSLVAFTVGSGFAAWYFLTLQPTS